ncbi:Ubiquitin-like protein [Handroanthus impetiginosus]|uniref:Ubiquitin-like protein n=1 Tax=Handroanthus impetiginosus TaxID=429701 RepID=A0A2G9GS64_9LAMI|nr:Ubiquitin-like protein [Handroanthus impetiginosus]
MGSGPRLDDPHLPSPRMRMNQTALPSSSNSPPSPSPFSSLYRSTNTDSAPALTCLQFFVRILSEHTLVLHAHPDDTIKSVHEKIQSITGIPIMEQRLTYRGKQLQWEQTLAQCEVQNDAGLHLIGRMRSTEHPQAWQLINDIVSLIFHMLKKNPPPPPAPLLAAACHKTVKTMLVEYAQRSDDNKWILDCKEVTNFEARRHLALMMLPELKDDYEDLYEMLIDRSNLLAESFEYIAHADIESLHAGLFMKFKNEEATGPGVLREWFFLICQAIFNLKMPFSWLALTIVEGTDLRISWF